MQRKEPNVIAAGKPQVCPHGSSLPCSQCAGAVARKVTFDPVGGVMVVDGEAVRDGVEEQRNNGAARRRTQAGYRSPRRPSRCSSCGALGHMKNSRKCRAEEKDAA